MPQPSKSASKVQAYLRNISGKVTPVTEVVTIAAGIAGTLVSFGIKQHPIANAKGTDSGGSGDSSLAINSGTVFTTLVGEKADADLANGEYYVNHITGEGRGRKADNTTSITFGFDIFAILTISGGATDTELPASDTDTDTDADLSTPDVAARMKGFNGTVWQKIRTAVTTIGSTFTGFLNSLPWGIYHSVPTARTDGQGGPLETDADGALVARPRKNEDVTQSAVITLTNTTETTLKAAAASTYYDLASIKLNNTSATAVRCDLRDDANGTVIDTFYLPAGDIRGIVYHLPWKQTAANKNWTVQLSASVTDVRITAQFVTRK